MTGSFDTFTDEEARGATTIMRDLKNVEWARQLLNSIDQNDGVRDANMSRFFELRFGFELHSAGIVPCYEIPGEGGSTLDFGFETGGRRFRVELMRLTETEAAAAATNASIDVEGTAWTTRVLMTDARDKRQSEEGETLKAVQRICQKFEQDGRPHKFPDQVAKSTS